MPKDSKDKPRRFPNLSNLGIAIFEHLVESIIGDAAIEEAKKPYAEKQIADALGEALTKVEADFIAQYKDQDARDVLLQLPISNLSSAATAIWEFYKRPNVHTFEDLLVTQLKTVRALSTEQIDSAVGFYLKLLRRELINVDPELREKIHALADVESAGYLREIRDAVTRQSVTPLPEGQEASPPLQKVAASPGNLPGGSYLPFARNALFTGRDAAMDLLEESLLAEQVESTLISQAVMGMGGMGKTQLAVEFAYRYGYKFKGVHWLDLRDLATLDSQIAECGTQMLLRPWSSEQPEQVLLTLAAWKQEGPRLLILDNFEDPLAAPQVLSRFQDPNLRLLITSRRSDWPASLGFRNLPLELFTEQESVDFLGKYTLEKFSTDQLGILADRLGRLPLALELAGRYLEKHPRLTLEEYLSQLVNALDHEAMRGFRKDLPNPTQHDLDLLSTFSLSWELIADENAQQAFMVAGYCAPNTPIPLEIFEKVLNLDETACDGVLDFLLGLGLLQKNVSVHPLLADFARYLDPDHVVLSVLAEKLADLASELNDEVDLSGNYALFSPILYHVRSVAEQAEIAQIESSGNLWNSLGYHIQHSLADYAGAQTALERGLKIAEAAYGPNHPNVATVVNNLGLVLHDQGDYAGAQAAYERALRIDEAAFGPDHPRVAIRVNNLGEVLRTLGDYAGAKAAYERALKIDEAAFGPDHPNVAAYVSNLGSVLQDLGEYADAQAAFERALKIDETAFGPDHPNVARDVSNLGNVLHHQGDYVGAQAAYERALKINEATFGPDHPKVARDVNSLGLVLEHQGDNAGAQTALERGLKIAEAAYGPNHPNVATVVNNLGLVLHDQGDYAGAQAAYERALRIDEAALGPDHPKVATDVNNLGNVLRAQGDWAGAQAAYERALRILKQTLPEGHPNIKTAEKNLREVSDADTDSSG